MKNRQILKLFLSSLFVLALAACGGNNTSKSSTPSVSTPTPSVSTPSVSTPTPSISSSSSVTETKIDYVSQTKIASEGWKTKTFLNDGVGIVTLARTIDGDTAHFYDGGRIVEIRFNGVNTPESTGRVEPWGKGASDFTKNQLLNAKTIVIETEKNENIGGPVADSTGSRYMGWVWISDKPADQEDGSTLKLLNLMLIAESFSATKGVAGSVYSQTFIDCDLQAQKDNLRIWSKDDDPDFYYGSAINTNLKDLLAKGAEYLGKRVAIEGVVSRTVSTNAYLQESFEDEETGAVETYGIYVFTQYRDFSAVLSKGNRVRIIGVVGEYPQGSAHYQLTDVYYDDLFPNPDKDMKLISTGNFIEPQVGTPNDLMNVEHYNHLVTIKNVKITGGYGGQETGEDNNAMTLYATADGQSLNIRIDASAFIKDLDGKTIKNYQYFVGKSFDITGLVGYYESISGRQTYQLMLVGTSDLVYL